MREGDRMASAYAKTVDLMKDFTGLTLEYNKDTLERDVPRDSNENKTLEQSDDVFPCLLVILGSTFGQFKVGAVFIATRKLK